MLTFFFKTHINILLQNPAARIRKLENETSAGALWFSSVFGQVLRFLSYDISSMGSTAYILNVSFYIIALYNFKSVLPKEQPEYKNYLRGNIS